MKELTSKIHDAAALLIKQGRPEKGKIFVLGASTSEVYGNSIGSSSNIEIAVAIWSGIQTALKDSGLYLAVQCCEHLNRALVVERECLKDYRLNEVTVVPAGKAGGATAAYAYQNFKDPVVVENISGDYGMDIGQTLIGMHLKPVAVPFRTTYTKVGNAILTLAYSRPKLIGGERAKYCL